MYTCSCGEFYSESIAKTAHQWQTTTTEHWVVDQAAYNETVKTLVGGYQCNECGQRYSSEECRSGDLDQHQISSGHGSSSSWSEYEYSVIHHEEQGHMEISSETSCKLCGIHQ